MKRKRGRDSRGREAGRHWSWNIVFGKTMNWTKWDSDEKKIVCEKYITCRRNLKDDPISYWEEADKWKRKRDWNEYLDNRTKKERHYRETELARKNWANYQLKRKDPKIDWREDRRDTFMITGSVPDIQQIPEEVTTREARNESHDWINTNHHPFYILDPEEIRNLKTIW